MTANTVQPETVAATTSATVGEFPRSRRALLAAALGAGAAAIASAVAAAPVRAANGDAVLVGNAFTGTVTTQISTTGANPVFKAIAGTSAQVGLLGQANAGYGVRGTTLTGTAVDAVATDAGGTALAASATGTGGLAGSFFSALGTGIDVSAGTGIGAAVQSSSGAYGISAQASEGIAIWARGKIGISVSAFETDPTTTALAASHGEGNAINASTAAGYGLYAMSSTGVGVYGTSTSAQGIYGDSLNGVGVYARSVAGTALEVSGKVKLSRSGRVTILKGKTSVAITVAGGVASTSLCFAHLAMPRTGVWITAVRPNYPAGKMTVYLNKAITANTVIVWFVLA